MVYIIRKNLEQNLARLTLVFFISMGVKSCIYSPIRRYEGITKSMNEVAAFQSGGIADINNDGTLSEEEKRVRDNFYEECKNNFFEIGVACSFPTGNWGSESERIFSCMKEKYKPKEKFLI
ncbi:MAG: hypothetical protein QT08_C0026G0011 [archaeon GW2011_AR17]|nr:MAG: hypothetical protein QT08_C0026G0011 [archaeon GW2011_AR17]